MKKIINYILLLISMFCLPVGYVVGYGNVTSESSGMSAAAAVKKTTAEMISIIEQRVFCVPQTTVIVAPANTIDMIIHAVGSTYKFEVNGEYSVPGDHRVLAGWLKGKGYNTKTIRLLSCSDLNSAQNLSNKLNQPVIATDGYVCIYSDGGLSVVPRDGNGSTKWYLLKPNATRIEAASPRAPGNFSLDYVQMGGSNEVDDLLSRKVNINNLANPPNGYQFFYRNNNTRKYIRRIDISSSLKKLTVDENNIIVEYTGPQRLSQPGQLSQNLGPAPNENHQAHHIIPDAVVRTHWFYLAVYARSNNTYNLDRVSNGIYLATSEEYFVNGISDMYPTHNGSHPIYQQKITQMIEKVLKDQNITASNFSQLTFSQINTLLSYFESEGIEIIKNWNTDRLN